jgi:hypothetical protein
VGSAAVDEAAVDKAAVDEAAVRGFVIPSATRDLLPSYGNSLASSLTSFEMRNPLPTTLPPQYPSLRSGQALPAPTYRRTTLRCAQGRLYRRITYRRITYRRITYHRCIYRPFAYCPGCS